MDVSRRSGSRTENRKVAIAPFRIVAVIFVIVLSLQVQGAACGLPDPQSRTSSFELSGSDAHAKNVILMIGDGMGPVHIEAGRWAKAGNNPDVYRTTSLAMDRLEYSGNVSTSSANSPITDSAAAITALMTGVKTNNGVIGEDATAVLGVSDGARLSTIAELAKADGRATGVVSTARLTHATPAGVYAHVNRRENELLIGRQFLDSDLDVALSGGYYYFIPQGTTDPWGADGLRTDGRNLVAEAQARGYTVVNTGPSLDALPTTPGTKVLGLFAPSTMKYEIERAGSQQPNLSAMTGKAIAELSTDEDGFFLMVEGGLIDIASHANNGQAMTGDVLAFDDAVQTALTFADQHPDTLLIVTADHETGGLALRDDGNGGITLLFTTTDHTASDVRVMASGPGAERFGNSRVSNTGVFEVMRDTMNLHPVTPTPTAGVVGIPDGAGRPRSLAANGIYDDVNGNGRKDFADVVLYFNDMAWIATNEPVTAFDYNGNGRIDFADVVWLFTNL